jgi:hypothetical protein
MEKLKKNYENACNAYLKEFCKKQYLSNEGWVNNEVGGIALCGDFFFNFLDIVWDINTNQPKRRIIKWYDLCMDNVVKSINYSTYCKVYDDSKANIPG